MHDHTGGPVAPKTLRRQPRQQRSRDRLNAILDAGADLLATVGPAGTTITAVAAQAGLATSSIYDYVEGDRELIGAVAERGLDRIHVELTAVLGDLNSLDELLPALSSGLRLFLGRYQMDRGLREALAFVDADPALMTINLADTRRNAALITDALGRFEPDAGLETAVLLVTHLSGALANLAARVDDDEAERLIVEFERLLAVMLSPS